MISQNNLFCNAARRGSMRRCMTPLVEASYPYGAAVKGVMLRMTWLPCGFEGPRAGKLDALVAVDQGVIPV
jgi:hypothetical protein